MNYCKINTPLYRMQQLQTAAMLEMQALLKEQQKRKEEFRQENIGDTLPPDSQEENCSKTDTCTSVPADSHHSNLPINLSF